MYEEAHSYDSRTVTYDAALIRRDPRHKYERDRITAEYNRYRARSQRYRTVSQYSTSSFTVCTAPLVGLAHVTSTISDEYVVVFNEDVSKSEGTVFTANIFRRSSNFDTKIKICFQNGSTEQEL